MKVAVVAWECRPARSIDDFMVRIEAALRPAAQADLIVLPECFTLDLCGLLPDLEPSVQVRGLCEFAPEIVEALQRASDRADSIIVGGSHFVARESEVVHLCSVHTPHSPIAFQTKNVLTQFERVEWGLSECVGLTSGLPEALGVLVCYDSEFPEAGRAWAERGAKILAVPAFTETEHGFNRVRTGCLARALENQQYVILAGLVGGLGLEPVPTTFGSSAIVAPMTPPFPASGVLAESPPNEPGVLIYDLDVNLLEAARNSGDVRNWNDRSRSDWRFI